MDKNVRYAIKRGYGFPVILRLDQMKLLLEAFTTWLYDDDYGDNGKASNPEYREVIATLERKIAELGG